MAHLATTLKQHFRWQLVKVLDGVDERRVPPTIDSVDVHFRLQKPRDKIVIAVGGCDVQRRATVVV